MAQDIINNILKGLQIHQEKILKQQEQQLERDRLDEQTKQHGEQVKLEHEKLDAANEQFKVNHALIASQAAASMIQAKQAINKSIMEGIPVEGDTQTPQVTQGMQQQSQPTPGTGYDTTNVGSGGSDTGVLGNLPQQRMQPTLDINSIQHSIPIGDQTHNVTLPTPEQHYRDLAAGKRILIAPEEEAKTREALALQSSKNAETEKSKQSDFEREIVRLLYESSKATEHEAAETARSSATNAAADARNRYTVDHKDNVDGVDLGPYAQNAFNGTMTQEEIMKLPLPKPAKMLILGAVTGHGGRVLTSKEQASMQDFGTISSTVPQLDRALQLLKDHSIKVRTPGTREYKEFNEINGQLELVLPQVARAIAGDKGRLSNLQMELVNGGFIPKLGLISNDYENNVRRRNDFVKLMNDLMDNRIPGVTPAQKELFKENFNIKDLHPHIEGKSSGTTAAPPQTTTPPTTPGGLNPAAIELLKKHGISVPASSVVPSDIQPKSFPRARLKEFADTNHITVEQAEKALKEANYSVN